MSTTLHIRTRSDLTNQRDRPPSLHGNQTRKIQSTASLDCIFHEPDNKPTSKRHHPSMPSFYRCGLVSGLLIPNNSFRSSCVLVHIRKYCFTPSQGLSVGFLFFFISVKPWINTIVHTCSVSPVGLTAADPNRPQGSSTDPSIYYFDVCVKKPQT